MGNEARDAINSREEEDVVLLEKEENNRIGNTTASWLENKSAYLINSLIKCTLFISDRQSGRMEDRE